MYKEFYGLTANPFQLTPDPKFFFGSKVHKRAIAYLQYGLLREEGFIVITGEIGAGKTTLLNNLFRKLEPNKIVAAQIVNTNFNSEDTLRMVAEAFGLPYEDTSKASLLTNIESFLNQCDHQGKRALLLVDEVQSLTPQSIEELRMLSNFQTDEKSLLQIFLIGQPEFRETLHGNDMKQLKQRVIASYHLGPMDIDETRSYIEHRLTAAKWSGDPKFSKDAFTTIFDFTGGIPRKINSLCDRLLLMGCLEGIHFFGKSEVDEVTRDMQQEFALPVSEAQVKALSDSTRHDLAENFHTNQLQMDSRLSEIERSVNSILALFKHSLPGKTQIEKQ